MKLNHINLIVKNVDQAVALFTEHLDFQLIIDRNGKMAVLENNGSFALVIWGQVLNKTDGIPQYPSNFHIGFYQDNEAAVKSLYQKIRTVSGLQFESEPKRIRDTFGFYFYFENLMIEISVNPFRDIA
ncbi:VOC family protein [Chryseobacterium culicis]|uniref:VOC family protein n=1 Tax=Chryseobacterium culicis TaxID=680127 RepID=UPI0028962BFC|nr:VOC family protein [Chryseobacterium culicis]